MYCLFFKLWLFRRGRVRLGISNFPQTVYSCVPEDKKLYGGFNQAEIEESKKDRKWNSRPGN